MNELRLPPYNSKTWFECNAPLLEATLQPTVYGFATAGELMAAIARDRNLSTRALTKQLDAARFLRATYPDLVKSGQVLGGYSQTEYLQKIHGVSPARAHALAPRVVSGEISMARMRQEFDAAMSIRGDAGSTGAMARRRVVEFEYACRAVLLDRLGQFTSSKAASVADRFDLNGHNLDYAIVDGTRVLCAIECRIGGMRNTQREAFDLVGTLAMYTRRAESACLLLPVSAAQLSEAVHQVIISWGVERVNIGVVTEGAVHEVSFKQVST